MLIHPLPKKIGAGKGKKYQNKTGFHRFDGIDGKHYKISLIDMLFCKAYLEFRGSPIEAALNTFNLKDRKKASVKASQLLQKKQVREYIRAKLEEYGFNDDNVTKQHLFNINQFGDLSVKNKAIDMYYKKSGQYAPERHLVEGSLGRLLEEIANEKQNPVKPKD